MLSDLDVGKHYYLAESKIKLLKDSSKLSNILMND